MKTSILSLACSLLWMAIFMGGCGYSKSELEKMDHSGVKLSASFPNWGSNNSTPEIVLTLVNPMDQSRNVVLPCPLHVDAMQLASLDRPTLMLLVKDASSKSEEEIFILGSFARFANNKPKVLTLKPGESVQMSYKLASFYSFGVGGLQEEDSFTKIFQLGEHEIDARALIAYSDMELAKADLLESSSVVFKCNFPQWMFKKGVEQKK